MYQCIQYDIILEKKIASINDLLLKICKFTTTQGNFVFIFTSFITNHIYQ